jgi:hypothetical protein
MNSGQSHERFLFVNLVPFCPFTCGIRQFANGYLSRGAGSISPGGRTENSPGWSVAQSGESSTPMNFHPGGVKRTVDCCSCD